MRLLTDCAAVLGSFFASAVDWQKHSTDEVDAQDAALWHVAGGAGEMHVTERELDGPRRLFSRVAVIADAPRSQYDALHAAIGEQVELQQPTACLALAGRGFHGQRGRGWEVAGGNLFLTVGLAPHRPAADLIPALTTLPALAVVDAVRSLGSPGMLGVKWVNDILIDGAKVGGVLTATHVLGSDVQTVVFGIGINLAIAPLVEPTPFVPSTTSLHAAGIKATLGQLFWVTLDAIAGRYQELTAPGGSRALLEAYRRESLVVGQTARLWEDESELTGDPAGWPEPLASGLVEAIEDDLSLRLASLDEPVHKGRLALESACRQLGLPASD